MLDSIDIVLRERSEIRKLWNITWVNVEELIQEVDMVIHYLLEWNQFSEEWIEMFRECVAFRTTEIMKDILFFDIQ